MYIERAIYCNSSKMARVVSVIPESISVVIKLEKSAMVGKSPLLARNIVMGCHKIMLEAIKGQVIKLCPAESG